MINTHFIYVKYYVISSYVPLHSYLKTLNLQESSRWFNMLPGLTSGACVFEFYATNKSIFYIRILIRVQMFITVYIRIHAGSTAKFHSISFLSCCDLWTEHLQILWQRNWYYGVFVFVFCLLFVCLFVCLFCFVSFSNVR